MGTIDEIDESFGRKFVGVEKFTQSLGIKVFPKRLLILVERTSFHDQIFRRVKFIIAYSKSQGKMKEESIHNFSIYGAYSFQLATSEINDFRKIDLMVKRIRKSCFECLGVKSISGKIEVLKGFHTL